MYNCFFMKKSLFLLVLFILCNFLGFIDTALAGPVNKTANRQQVCNKAVNSLKRALIAETQNYVAEKGFIMPGGKAAEMFEKKQFTLAVADHIRANTLSGMRAWCEEVEGKFQRHEINKEVYSKTLNILADAIAEYLDKKLVVGETFVDFVAKYKCDNLLKMKDEGNKENPNENTDKNNNWEELSKDYMIIRDLIVQEMRERFTSFEYKLQFDQLNRSDAFNVASDFLDSFTYSPKAITRYEDYNGYDYDDYAKCTVSIDLNKKSKVYKKLVQKTSQVKLKHILPNYKHTFIIYADMNDPNNIAGVLFQDAYFKIFLNNTFYDAMLK